MRLPESGEFVGQVVEFLGGSRVKVEKKNGVKILARITRKIKTKRIKIEKDDYVLISPWEIEPEKGDIVWRYKKTDISYLKHKGFI